jgi:hypothetical protein
MGLQAAAQIMIRVLYCTVLYSTTSTAINSNNFKIHLQQHSDESSDHQHAWSKLDPFLPVIHTEHHKDEIAKEDN